MPEMTLTEAIKIVEYINCTDDTHLYSQGHAALELLIKAGERVKMHKALIFPGFYPLLPGETPE